MQNKQDPFAAKEALMYEWILHRVFAKGAQIYSKIISDFSDWHSYIQGISKHVHKILMSDSLNNFLKINS